MSARHQRNAAGDSMLWCEVRVTVPLEQAETAAEVLREAAPAGVSIEEPVIPLGPEEGVRLDRSRPAVVACYLFVDDGLGVRLDEIDRRFTERGLHPEIVTRRVEESSWADAWKEYFHVERVSRRIVIKPSWREYTPRSEDIVIELDPGMAFGTGQHATTRGCLALLDESVRPGMAILDVGTGSGILAVAAAKLGAASVLAVDVEPQSIAVTRENADRNGVGAAIRVALGSLGDAWPFPESPVALADLVVANIHARVLLELADSLRATMRPGGVLLLSGVIDERETDVQAAFVGLGLHHQRTLADGDWRTLAFAL